MTEKIDKLLPDTSVIIEGLISEKIKKKDIKVNEVIIHEAVLAELEHQANLGKSIGYVGLDEITEIKKLSSELGFQIRFMGKRPNAAEIKYSSMGEIDSLIRDLAWEEEATLFTADKVQKKVAEAKGMRVLLIEKTDVKKKIKLESFFDKNTMSVHLRENNKPYAKIGVPGKWDFKPLRTKVLSREEIEEMNKEIIEETKSRNDGFIEISRRGSTIIQLGNYRIVITKPPFSDGWEITAVKPIRILKLEDYKLDKKLLDRLNEKADGVLIAGAPGMGKSTFAGALAENYASKNKIVKTVEAPRDLQLGDNITQYAISYGSSQEIHDILLLSRPDHVIFDEMRNTSDFMLFADLRLAGIGFLGVVHATNPVDSIQRFMSRLELGVIPQIIDTVIFIKEGKVSKVLSLEMCVKVPSGMTEADLARPVVEVRDFNTNKLEFEIYSYGEQTIIIPVKKQEMSAAKKLASATIEQTFSKYGTNVKAEILDEYKAVVYVPKEDIAKIIGKQGRNIDQIEKEIGIKIDVEELEDGKENMVGRT